MADRGNQAMSNFQQIVRTVEPRDQDIRFINRGKTGSLLVTYPSGIKAVVKVAKHSTPAGKQVQRELPVASQPRREVAFYRLAKMFGWEDLVPETHLINFRGRQASAQVWVPAFKLEDLNANLKGQDWTRREELVKTCRMVPEDDWVRLLILDLIACSRDRHFNNAGFVMTIENERPKYRLRGWDNACSFGRTFRLYNNVFHKVLFRSTLDLTDYWPVLETFTRTDFEMALDGVNRDPGEPGEARGDERVDVDHAFLRLQFMLEYPHRLPWRIMSEGQDGADDFPDYAEYFQLPSDQHPKLGVVAG